MLKVTENRKMNVDPIVPNTEANTWSTEDVHTPQPVIVEDVAVFRPRYYHRTHNTCS